MKFHRPPGEAFLIRRPRALTCLRRLSGVLMVMAAGVPVAIGQERLLPIRLGRFLFSPSLVVSNSWENNVERVNEDQEPLGPIDSEVTAIRPILRFDFPYEKSFARLVYRGDFREYSAAALSDLGGASHLLEFVGHFEAARVFRLDVEEHYLNGITGLLNEAPGGEFRYVTQPLETWETRLAMDFDLSPTHSLEIGGIRSDTTFEQSATSEFFQNLSTRSLFLRYVLDRGPASEIYGSAEMQSVQQEGDLLFRPADYRVRSLGVGFRRATSKDLSSEAEVSYSATKFTEGSGTPFRGLTLDAQLVLSPAPGNVMQVRLRRAPLPSFFDVSPYYLNEAVEVEYMRPLGRAFGLQVLLGVRRNRYSDPVSGAGILSPSKGERREDFITGGTVSLGWHVNRAAAVSLAYRAVKSRSNIVAEGADGPYDIYDNRSDGVVLTVTGGW